MASSCISSAQKGHFIIIRILTFKLNRALRRRSEAHCQVSPLFFASYLQDESFVPQVYDYVLSHDIPDSELR